MEELEESDDAFLLEGELWFERECVCEFRDDVERWVSNSRSNGGVGCEWRRSSGDRAGDFWDCVLRLERRGGDLRFVLERGGNLRLAGSGGEGICGLRVSEEGICGLRGSDDWAGFWAVS